MDDNPPSNPSPLNPTLPSSITAAAAAAATPSTVGPLPTSSPTPSLDTPSHQHPQQQQQQQQQQQLFLAQSQLAASNPSDPTLTQQQQQQQQMLSSQTFPVQPGARAASSLSRINSAQYAMRPDLYAQQQQQQSIGMNFAPHLQQQAAAAAVAGGSLSRSALIGQAGHLPMLPGQATQFTNFPSQLLAQPRKGLMQSSQFQTANSSGQQLQGMQTLSMMGSLGLNSQLRSNGSLPYIQQRMMHGQMRPQQLPQQPTLTSPQKLQTQGLPRSPSLNSHLSGLSQNGPAAMMQNSLAQQQQQWLKQMQPSMSTPGSPSYHLTQQQRQALLQQQLSSASQSNPKQPMSLNQQQISQLVQQSQQVTQQQLVHQKQQAMQQQQQLMQQQSSPRMSALPIQRSPNFTGSQPGTPASGVATGGSASQGGESNIQLLGKRKIQDLVSQVDANGKVDPEVEDYLLELADEFVDSVTAFACGLAKHRKASTLDSKDLLLHLEKNWQLTIPGFSCEEQKHHRKPKTSDVHQKRLAMIQKLMGRASSETENVKEINGNSGVVGQQIKASHSSEALFSPPSGSPMLQKLPRF